MQSLTRVVTVVSCFQHTVDWATILKSCLNDVCGGHTARSWSRVSSSHSSACHAIPFLTLTLNCSCQKKFLCSLCLQIWVLWAMHLSFSTSASQCVQNQGYLMYLQECKCFVRLEQCKTAQFGGFKQTVTADDTPSTCTLNAAFCLLLGALTVSETYSALRKPLYKDTLFLAFERHKEKQHCRWQSEIAPAVSPTSIPRFAMLTQAKCDVIYIASIMKKKATSPCAWYLFLYSMLEKGSAREQAMTEVFAY